MSQNDTPLEPESADEAAGRERAVKFWIEQIGKDKENFLDPVGTATGLTRVELLLYLLGEQLGDVLGGGLVVQLTMPRPPENEEGEAWKRGRK